VSALKRFLSGVLVPLGLVAVGEEEPPEEAQPDEEP
jgi:hypothetical protein